MDRGERLWCTREMLNSSGVSLRSVGQGVEARVGNVLRRLGHAQHRVVDGERRRHRPVESDPLVRSLLG